MVEYTVFFPVLSTLTWDTLLTLRGTWGFYLNHLIPLRPFKSVFDNVLLEHQTWWTTSCPPSCCPPDFFT